MLVRTASTTRRRSSWSITGQRDRCATLSYNDAKNAAIRRGATQNSEMVLSRHA